MSEFVIYWVWYWSKSGVSFYIHTFSETDFPSYLWCWSQYNALLEWCILGHGNLDRSWDTLEMIFIFAKTFLHCRLPWSISNNFLPSTVILKQLILSVLICRFFKEKLAIRSRPMILNQSCAYFESLFTMDCETWNESRERTVFAMMNLFWGSCRRAGDTDAESTKREYDHLLTIQTK